MPINKIKDYLTISQAAQFLGVSPSTLRNWDKASQLKAVIQPISHYRLYRKLDLKKFLKKLARQQ